MAFIKPIAIQRSSPYSAFPSIRLSIGCFKISTASLKSIPCFRMLIRFLAVSHSKFTIIQYLRLYIQNSITMCAGGRWFSTHLEKKNLQEAGCFSNYAFYLSKEY